MPKQRLLTAKQQRDINDRLEKDARTPFRNAAATVWELIARKSLAADDKSTFPQKRKHQRFANLSDEQLSVMKLTGETSRDGLFPPGCIGDGILRRFTMDSPLELALRLSISARYHWAATQWNGNNYHEELFRPILHAIAARDFTAADHLAAISPPIVEKPDVRSYGAIFTGVRALMQRDRSLLRTAIGTFPKTDPAYVKSFSTVLQAVADEAPADFATGLNRMLSAYRRYIYNDELYGLIDPHALGLYELCRRFSPTVVADFDVERKLPWDREYFTWSQDVDDLSVHYDVDSIPEVIWPYLLDFEPIPWGPDVLANWHLE